MNLREYQSTLVRLAMAAEPALDDLAALQDERAFSLYRHMIRTRLVGMAKVAFKQSSLQLGETAFEACFARYLSEHPPRSPLIRDVVADFGPFARQDAGAITGGPAHWLDLLAFEEHKWRLSYLAGAYPSLGEAGLRELDFEGRPVWNFSLRILPQHYAVHQSSTEPAAREATLLMYRPPAIDEVRWYVADGFFVALLQRSLELPETLAELVQRVAQMRAVPLDEALLETLATGLTLAMQRGVLLGVC